MTVEEHRVAVAGGALALVLHLPESSARVPGVVAVRAGLAALLARPDLYALAEAGLIGHDHFEHFVRRG